MALYAVLNQNRSNSSTHIGRLPAELLSNIMVLAALDWQQLCKDFSQKQPLWKVGMSHVSRYWRSVALSTQALWTTIVLKTWSADAFTTFLTRSNQAPLWLELVLQMQASKLSGGTLQDAMILAARSVSRYQKLRIAAPRRFIRAFCNGVDSFPDLLQTLILAGESDSGCNYGPWDPPILPPLGTRVAHRLRHLELHNLPAQWSDLVFRSPLTTLVIDHERIYLVAHKEPPYMGTFEEMWTAFISLAPSLEALTLKYAIPDARMLPSSTYLIEDEHLSFPRLQHISIMDDPGEITAFLDRISFSTSCKLSIDTVASSDSPEFATIAVALARLYPRVFDEIFMDIEFIDDTSLELQAYVDDENARHKCRELLELKFFTTSKGDEHPFMMLVREAPALFANVRKVIAPGLLFGDRLCWEAFFQSVPNLSSLSLDRGDIPSTGFCDALGAVCPSGAEGELKLLVPKLTSLMLSETNFDKDMSEEDMKNETRTRFALELLAVLRTRAEAGVPLSDVTFQECRGVTREDVARMREHVRDDILEE